MVLPMTHKEKFENIGIKPPKGVLLYGPPGTGKTLMARACAAQTKSTFLKLAGPQLVQVGVCLNPVSVLPSDGNRIEGGPLLFSRNNFQPFQSFLFAINVCKLG